MSKLFERDIATHLPDTHEGLPALPDDVTIPDDASDLTHPGTPTIGRRTTGIRWMRWLSVLVLVTAGAIVAAVTLRSDDATAPTHEQVSSPAAQLIEQSINDALAEQQATNNMTASQLIEQSINDALAEQQATVTVAAPQRSAEALINQAIDEALAELNEPTATPGATNDPFRGPTQNAPVAQTSVLDKSIVAWDYQPAEAQTSVLDKSIVARDYQPAEAQTSVLDKSIVAREHSDS